MASNFGMALTDKQSVVALSGYPVAEYDSSDVEAVLEIASQRAQDEYADLQAGERDTLSAVVSCELQGLLSGYLNG